MTLDDKQYDMTFKCDSDVCQALFLMCIAHTYIVPAFVVFLYNTKIRNLESGKIDKNAYREASY